VSGSFSPRLRVATRALYILGAVGAVALGQAPTASAAVQTFVGVVPTVSSTSFDTGEQVDLTVVPIVLGVRGSRASIRASFPYLDVTARTPAYRIGGPILGLTIPGQEFDEHGAGDVVVTPALLLVDGRLDTPSLWGSLRVKLPTADETRYLGTGQLDYAPGLGLLIPTGSRWFVSATARYDIRGDTPDVDYRNTVAAGLAGIVLIRTDALTILVTRQDPLFEGADPTNAVGLSWFHPFNNGTALSTTGLVGLASEARTYGVALGITFNDSPTNWGGGSN
jgi:outer membrane putative beta-barrel porin/alpha-amylase